MSRRILDQLRAIPPGYKRADALDKIEQEYGAGFAKTLREQLETEERLRHQNLTTTARTIRNGPQ